MDPIGVRLTPDDLGASEFPLPGVFGPPRTAVHGRASTDPLTGELDPELAADGETVEGDPDSREYLIGDWYAPKPSRPLHSTRCVAISKSTGVRCRQWAVIGFERCSKHSGYNKLAHLAEYRERVIERARLDLLRGAPYAVESLVEMARDREINPAVRLKASSEILDRVGVKGGSDLEITVKNDGEMSPAETIRARLERLAESGAAAARELAASAGESVIDAEVVDDDERAS